MILQLIPKGLAGILVAALVSGLMSQISGALNSISTLFSYDLYKIRRPQATDKELVNAGKFAAGISLVFSLALLPLLNRYESIFTGLNDIISHIAPPITCVFVLGVIWRKASAKSAQFTLYIGSLVGLLVFIIGKLYPGSFIGQIPFMMMAFYLFCFCVLLQIVFSLLHPDTETVAQLRVVWVNSDVPQKNLHWKGLANYKLLSALLLITMAALFWIFR